MTFEGRKIFIEFDRVLGDSERSMTGYKADQRGNMTGDIIHQVVVFLNFNRNVLFVALGVCGS